MQPNRRSVQASLSRYKKLELCPACGKVFSNTTAGDAHRVGDHGVKEGPMRRRCLTTEEMRAKVYENGARKGESWYKTALIAMKPKSGPKTRARHPLTGGAHRGLTD